MVLEVLGAANPKLYSWKFPSQTIQASYQLQRPRQAAKTWLIQCNEGAEECICQSSTHHLSKFYDDARFLHFQQFFWNKSWNILTNTQRKMSGSSISEHVSLTNRCGYLFGFMVSSTKDLGSVALYISNSCESISPGVLLKCTAGKIKINMR